MEFRTLAFLVYFIILLHLTLRLEAREEIPRHTQVYGRTSRQIPFFSSWWSSSSTNKPENRKRDFVKPHVHFQNVHGLEQDKQLPYQNFSGNEVSERDSRFLSLFTVVKFDNTECLSTSGDNGTCYPAAECHRRGGAVNGKCARGYGVCCVCKSPSEFSKVKEISKTCGASTNQNCTYFTHNAFPSSFDGTGSCQMTVYKCSPHVCQIRLDFDSFSIAQPNQNGICSNDQFIVSGTTMAIPIICGVNTGNHMYIDVGLDNSPVTLSMVTSGPAYSRSWKIKVTQIKCRDLGRAPEGCLQYYRGVSGVIRTYNFDFTSGQQLSNQDYTSCIRVERNFCGIRYTACNDNAAQFAQGSTSPAGTVRPRAFSLTGQEGNEGAKQGANNCQYDWLTIPCATNSGRVTQTSGKVCQDRLCGDIFNSDADGTTATNGPVYSYVKPFRLHYHTDSNEVGVTTDRGNRGFCLNFIQQPCSTI